jgi:F-type H+-transporting ATPase subunit b
MLLFDAMELITPNLGLVFWTTICFLLFWLIVGKLAFKPIANAIKERERNIEEALLAAEKARNEMMQLQSDNAEALKKAQDEAAAILKDARELKAAIEASAQAKAKEEANKIIAEAKIEIEKKKQSALLEVKQEVSKLAIEIAEKVLDRELDSAKDHQKLITEFVDKLN